MKMLNDAARLAEVMRGVPREACPTWFTYHPQSATWGEMVGMGDIRTITNDTAEFACIGSMTAWLCARDCCIGQFKTELHGRDDYSVMDSHNGSWCSDTLIEALAAACRQIGLEASRSLT